MGLPITAGCDAINQSNVFIKTLLTSADVTKCCTETSLKPQTASNAGVEAQWLGKTP